MTDATDQRLLAASNALAAAEERWTHASPEEQAAARAAWEKAYEAYGRACIAEINAKGEK